MAHEKVQHALDCCGFDYRLAEFDRPFKSTLDASEMIGIEIGRIGKTMAFKSQSGAVVVIASGDAKVDNQRFKEQFGMRPCMLSPDELLEFTGYEPGNVTPIGINHKNVRIYVDASARRFDDGYIYPSGGQENSAVGISVRNLYELSGCSGYVDVCKGWKDR